MLIALSITNLAVIESVQLQFHQGFHVLTGETGAGKSIIIDALGLIGGARGSSEFVRYGCDRAEVEASFDLPADHPAWEAVAKLGIQADAEELLIIRRELTANGKSMCRINGQMVNLTMLREVGELLINIHGQHEHQSLLKVERHLDWLDAYGGEDLAGLKKRYREEFGCFMALQHELNQLKQTSQQAYQMLDLYRFQIEELHNANLQVGEDELLAEEKRKLANAEKLMDHVNHAYERLYGQGAMDAVSVAIAKLEDVMPYDAARFQPMVEQLQTAYYQLEDAAYQLRDYRENIEFNPERLEQIEDRLEQLNGLKRKYGATVEEMIAYGERIQAEADKIEHKDERIAALEKESEERLAKLAKRAQALSDSRRELSGKLTKRIEKQLQHLHMERTRLDVRLERLQDGQGFDVNGVNVRFTKNGWDDAEFLISPNPGEPLRPLHKIASGGELSRIMLALKTIFAEMDRIPVLVFDEVDTGVSGRAAQAIAEKLAEVSRSGQVFAITHLPQVACMADHHYYIEKLVRDERTSTQVTELQEQGRVAELARMLGGVEVTERTLHHAQEMLKLAERQKGA
ncbi:DNA repair protein RecN [Paenibacillus thiaminolyticus]|uniref:DNA repair protein RecN n=2 Tax=Paenibacillus thiaminolyticus TaxID=49283 RepID=A0AAP9DV28_PANTH|nr:DNA repair protein RecN [Paenibacillus thiaminolyticus]MCY9536322.1 DNA repair protein RecN [Paenibacillus thiaminolyticus]MCY9601334.1 DNA repair protein RecN [Paenibacillus thiaminolyticus]MCY9609344.1 DNA repair protein RecN [Paenibacillus thiaminolyticus]MCY9612989.1 DNA repair protein RecN [Paenibacillus thiaminolyticus]MCY9617027.1 DNA repair protein RecN [Paenibacillus thiaminolyticus]